MTDLVTWLRQQLDEDGRVASAVPAGPWRAQPLERGSAGPASTDSWVIHSRPNAFIAEVEFRPNIPARDIAAFVATHDPTRVLAEVAAKRAILDAYTEAVEFYDAPANRHHPAGEVHGLYTAVQWLAVPYAGRPGFDETWRPT